MRNVAYVEAMDSITNTNLRVGDGKTLRCNYYIQAWSNNFVVLYQANDNKVEGVVYALNNKFEADHVRHMFPSGYKLDLDIRHLLTPRSKLIKRVEMLSTTCRVTFNKHDGGNKIIALTNPGKRTAFIHYLDKIQDLVWIMEGAPHLLELFENGVTRTRIPHIEILKNIANASKEDIRKIREPLRVIENMVGLLDSNSVIWVSNGTVSVNRISHRGHINRKGFCIVFSAYDTWAKPGINGQVSSYFSCGNYHDRDYYNLYTFIFKQDGRKPYVQSNTISKTSDTPIIHFLQRLVAALFIVNESNIRDDIEHFKLGG